MPSPSTGKKPVVANGHSYRWPDKPVVVVCIDGGDPAYFQQFLREGVIPNIARFIQQGFSTVADGTVPSFTCPNNMSIITGTPASRHGISGNFYLDVRTGNAVVMTGPELLRGDTILARFAAAGAKVASITAKDKLRKQLAKGLDVIRAFTREQPALSLSQIAAATGLPAATARRCLHTLEEIGYVTRNGRSFLLRPKVLELGAAYLESMNIESLTHTHLEDLTAAQLLASHDDVVLVVDDALDEVLERLLQHGQAPSPLAGSSPFSEVTERSASASRTTSASAASSRAARQRARKTSDRVSR